MNMEIAEALREILDAKDNQGYNVKSGKNPNYKDLLLHELFRIEHFSKSYENELRVLSKNIRKYLWNYNNHRCSKVLYNILHRMNDCMELFSACISDDDFWNLNFIIDYFLTVVEYEDVLDVNISRKIVDKVIDELQVENAKKIIEKQWEDVLASKDGMKTFMEIFDDMFNEAVEKYPDLFVRKLDGTETLCRMVKEKSCDERRFIPWDTTKNQNRWNPPGKAFLYLSYCEKTSEYNEELGLDEYVCLLECRTDPGTDCCFCRFEPKVPGRIIDLSYNDTILSDHRDKLDQYVDQIKNISIMELLKDEDLFTHIDDELFVKQKIEDVTKSHFSTEKIVEFAGKTYLTLLSSSIYKKVDGSEDEKEKAYKSFHILSEYLQNKGITGIIYPCTRSTKIKGKNIVLFNPKDAEPIYGSIRQYHYDG